MAGVKHSSSNPLLVVAMLLSMSCSCGSVRKQERQEISQTYDHSRGQERDSTSVRQQATQIQTYRKQTDSASEAYTIEVWPGNGKITVKASGVFARKLEHQSSALNRAVENTSTKLRETEQLKTTTHQWLKKSTKWQWGFVLFLTLIGVYMAILLLKRGH
jgi:hypothetical protein